MDVDVFPAPAPELVKGYAARVRMNRRPWMAPVTIFDDGQAYVCRARAHPDVPVLIELEGSTPTEAQLTTLKMVWATLSNHFDFCACAFCDVLLPHAPDIMKNERGAA